MTSSKEQFNELIIKFLVEIADGKCSIDDEIISSQNDPYYKEILMGLLLLHEDLEYRFSMQVKMSLAYQQSQKEFETLYEEIPLPILMISPEFSIIRVNKSFISQFGLRRNAVERKDFFSLLISPDINEKLKHSFIDLESGKITSVQEEIKYKTKNADLWGLTTVSYVFDEITNIKYFIVSIQDITHLKTITEELERSNKDLEHFAFFASHDLQQPLRLITSYLQLIEKKLNTSLDPQLKSWFETVQNASKRMKTLISDLLTYSRVKYNAENQEQIDFSNILLQVKSNLQHLIQETDAIITNDNWPTDLKGDKTQFIQIFQNLLSNAMKFKSSELPKIHIGYKNEKHNHLFWFKDNGIGIDPAYHGKVFQLFQRLHNYSTIEGTGMGLAICKKIVDQYKGHIWLESKPAKGSTFYFTIPK